MTTPEAELATPYSRTEDANDRFKAGWPRRVAWCTGAAVIAHASVMGLSPAWDASFLTVDPTPPGIMELTWILPIESTSSTERAIISSVPAGFDPELTEEEPGDEPAIIGDATGEADLANALREGLFGRRIQAPSVIEPEVEPEPEVELVEQDPTPDGEEDEEAVIGGSASAAELLSTLEGDALDLDRLSSVRPELALMSPSAWLLIRNPAEVENFMRRTYRLGDLDPDAEGMVGVTLWIDENGSVEWAEISRSSGRSDLDEFALELFNEVIAFRPARERGVSMSTSAIFWVQFPW